MKIKIAHNQQPPQRIMKQWQLNNVDVETWDNYLVMLDQKMKQIQHVIQQNNNSRMIFTKKFITETLSATDTNIIETAHQWIGEINAGMIQKPWIDKKIIQLIHIFRKEKRKIRPILNRIRNLKCYHRKFTKNPNH